VNGRDGHDYCDYVEDPGYYDDTTHCQDLPGPSPRHSSRVSAGRRTAGRDRPGTDHLRSGSQSRDPISSLAFHRNIRDRDSLGRNWATA